MDLRSLCKTVFPVLSVFVGRREWKIFLAKFSPEHRITADSLKVTTNARDSKIIVFGCFTWKIKTSQLVWHREMRKFPQKSHPEYN
jgi:hypothetical protein